jgi:hypothetical protein
VRESPVRRPSGGIREESGGSNTRKRARRVFNFWERYNIGVHRLRRCMEEGVRSTTSGMGRYMERVKRGMGRDLYRRNLWIQWR